ncbi:hypothetical protein N7540_007342 [Penicillium herquei]|nr:hypothetical protein N7540_007342 [Penicillium herquei]
MSSQKELFTKTVPYQAEIWGLGGGHAISESKGTMTFTVQSEGGYQTLEFHDALYFSPEVEPDKVIPNLISVSRLLEQYPNARIQFTTESCSVEMNQGQGKVIHISVKRGDFNFVMVKEIPTPEQDRGECYRDWRKDLKDCEDHKDHRNHKGDKKDKDHKKDTEDKDEKKEKKERKDKDHKKDKKEKDKKEKDKKEKDKKEKDKKEKDKKEKDKKEKDKKEKDHKDLKDRKDKSI